jgi:uncharacterized protein (DUF1684 family)
MGWKGRTGGMGWIGGMGRMGRIGTARRPAFPALPAFPARPALVLAIALSACSSRPPDEPKDYVSKIAAERAAKDAAFTAGDDPIPKASHAQFLPLGYFAIDPDYDAPAALKPIDDKTIYEMPTSTGANRKMRRVGSLEFTLKGQPMKLLAFNEVGTDPGSLFVAFSDLTNGTETYAVSFVAQNAQQDRHHEVDFNRANPIAITTLYECPPRRRKPAEDSDSGRREDEVGSQK